MSPLTTLSDVIADALAVAAISAATVAALDLDSAGRVEHWHPDRADVTLGLILVHLTTETALHAGHADILRELIDGAAGMRPDSTNLPGLSDRDWSAHHEQVEQAARQAARE